MTGQRAGCHGPRRHVLAWSSPPARGPARSAPPPDDPNATLAGSRSERYGYLRLLHLLARQRVLQLRRRRTSRSGYCPGSDWNIGDGGIVRGETDEEIFAQVRPHAATVHGAEITPETEDQLRLLVHDE
ncbi:MAG: DUF1059 domain-containing protein [Acidimicrobiales bacterium]